MYPTVESGSQEVKWRAKTYHGKANGFIDAKQEDCEIESAATIVESWLFYFHNCWKEYNLINCTALVLISEEICGSHLNISSDSAVQTARSCLLNHHGVEHLMRALLVFTGTVWQCSYRGLHGHLIWLLWAKKRHASLKYSISCLIYVHHTVCPPNTEWLGLIDWKRLAVMKSQVLWRCYGRLAPSLPLVFFRPISLTGLYPAASSSLVEFQLAFFFLPLLWCVFFKPNDMIRSCIA